MLLQRWSLITNDHTEPPRTGFIPKSMRKVGPNYHGSTEMRVLNTTWGLWGGNQRGKDLSQVLKDEVSWKLNQGKSFPEKGNRMCQREKAKMRKALSVWRRGDKVRLKEALGSRTPTKDNKRKTTSLPSFEENSHYWEDTVRSVSQGGWYPVTEVTCCATPGATVCNTDECIPRSCAMDQHNSRSVTSDSLWPHGL